MEIEKLFGKGQRILILSHHNADIDAVGASIALYEYLDSEADLAVPDSVSKGAKDLAGGYEFLKNPGLENYDLLVIVDCPSKEQLKPLDIETFKGKKVLIDHHSPGNLADIVDTDYTDPHARSTSELVYELLGDNWEPTKEAARALICGIVADTSHLKLAGKKQFKYISELLPDSGSEYSEILSVLSTPIDRSERIARIKAASRIEGYNINDSIVVFSYVGSFEAASARSLIRLGADVAIVFSPRDNEMRVSGRCRREMTEKLHLGEDVFSKVEDVLEGSAGGHDAAASGNGKNTDFGEVKEEMLKTMEEVLGGDREKL